MAAVKGVNATKLATNIGSNVIDVGYNKAIEYVMYDTYSASSLASGSTIAMGDVLPNGAVIVDIIVKAADLGTTTGTIAIGDSADDDRYIAAYATGSATAKSLAVDGVIGGLGYKVGTNSGDNQILITTAGGVTLTGDIKIIIKYAL